MKIIISLLIIAMLLAGCASAGQDQETARLALVNFFERLSSAQYEDAVALFDGDYEVLTGYNPDIDPADHARLLQDGCQINGFQCLQVWSAEFKEQNGDTIVFTVEFSNPDGSLFVLGPCCGADETQMPPKSSFEFRVQKSGGKYLVLDLPVYMP